MNTTAWPADRVERRDVASLIPYARNARTHSDAQVAQIAASIAAFGWTNPVLIDEDNGIIAGHGRVLAARSLGMDAVPCIVLAGLAPAQKAALVIADNKLSLNAGWDQDLLADELRSLQALDIDLSLTGFDDIEIRQMLEPPVDPNTLWDGMPDFNFGAKAHRSIVVHFKTAEDVADFAERIGQPISEKVRSLWHPHAEPETLADKAWVAQAAE